MRIDIDSILGSARKINRQMESPEETPGGSKKGGATMDSVEIENRIKSRIESIQTELKDLQTSLTRNQTISEGITLLQEDLSLGGGNLDAIMDSVVFNGDRVLRDFVGAKAEPGVLESRQQHAGNLIRDDAVALARLEVELENIVASNMGPARTAEDLLSSIDKSFARVNNASLNAISNVRADAVMRLVK